MNKKLIVFVIVAVVVLAGGYLLLKGYQLPGYDSASNATPIQNDSAPNVVVYTDSGYEPASFTIKVGDVLNFKNSSSQSNWTASAMHPTHTVYPTTGGCLGSTFDACKGVQPGDSWSFRFDVVGNWKYHNHLNPKHFGTVIVEE